MKRKISGLKAIGNNTYTDRSNRTIYGDYKNNKGYVVDNSNKRMYTILSNRFFLSISIGLICGYYFSWYIGLAILVALYVVLELIFKFYFLNKLQVIEDMEFPEKSSMSKQMEQKSDGNIVLLVITDIALSVFLVINIFRYIDTGKILAENFANTNNVIIVIASIGIIIFSMYMAIQASIVLYKRKSK